MLSLKFTWSENKLKRFFQAPLFMTLFLAWGFFVVLTLPSPASDSWPPVKVSTWNAGLHHVTAARLAAALGVSSNDVRDRILQGRFQLLQGGNATRWLAGTDGLDLMFHAGALRNNYTTQNVYWLVEGTNPPPLCADGGSPGAATNGWYLASTNCEQDLYARYELATSPDSNYWYWANLVTGHLVRSKFSTSVFLDALGDTNALAHLSVRVCGGMTTTNIVAVAVNGTTNAAWQGSWVGKVPATFDFDIPAGLLKTGSNNIRFTALGASWWLDGFTLDFPRPYTTRAGALQFSARSNTVITLAGFTNSLVTVLDVTHPLEPVTVTNLLVENAGGQWRASFAPASPDARYSAAQPGGLLEPLSVEAVWTLNLASPTNRAECVIITPATLKDSAAALASYRIAQGLETRVIPLEAVYNEFNAGLSEPEALRTFLQHAFNHWQLPPAYVVLAGNGTYDYRNLMARGDNLVPPLMVMTLYGLTASDSDLGDFGGAMAPLIAIGRLPATNSAHLTRMIDKIKAYEALPSPATNRALLVADLPDPAAGDFPAEILAVSNIVSASYQTTVVPTNTPTQMHNQVLGGLNAGTDLMCYLGHGAATQFGGGSPGYLAISDLASLGNAGRLPFIAGITCLAGNYAEPGGDCLSKAFVSANGPGAIAVMAASGFSLDYEAVELNRALMTMLSDGTTGRLGEHVRDAMLEYNMTPHFTPSGMFNLMGDPALRMSSTPLPPPWISGVEFTGDQGFAITLNATAGKSCSLLATTNLLMPLSQWTLISTCVAPAGPFVMTDPAATNLIHRFYDIRQP
jgi:hypothetical protein